MKDKSSGNNYIWINSQASLDLYNFSLIPALIRLSLHAKLIKKSFGFPDIFISSLELIQYILSIQGKDSPDSKSEKSCN